VLANQVPDVAARRFGDIRHRLGAIFVLGILRERFAIRPVGGKAAGRKLIDLAFVIVRSTTTAVRVRHIANRVFVGMGLGCPCPAVAAHFAAIVKVIEQHEALRDRMLIGRDGLAK